MRTVLFCFVTLFCIQIRAQRPSLDGLHGNVRSIEEHCNKAKKKRLDIVPGRRTWEYVGMHDYLTELDSTGKEIRTTYFLRNGDIYAVRSFTYDVHGIATKRIITNYSKKGRNDSDSYINEYSQDGKLIKRFAPYDWDDSNWEYNYVQDSSGFIHEVIHKPGDSTKAPLESAIYFPNWKMKLKNTFHPNGGLIGYKEYSYDSLWRLTKVYWCSGSGFVLSSLHYKYGSNDELLQYEYWDHIKEKHDYFDYKYTFDAQRNWTRCIEYRNGKAAFVRERKIIYR